MADDITVKLGFDGTAAESGLNKLRKESESFSDQLTKRLAGAFAAMTLFDKGVAFATRTFEKFADVSDRAERAGITAEDFQRISYAAELSGTSMEAAAKAMREIRNATADAAAGSKKATEALLGLGFTQEEITKGEIKSTDVLLRMAQAYKLAGSDAAKFAVATSILSTRNASELLPLLGTSQAELQGAMGRDVVSQAVADQMKAVADQCKLATQALEMFTIGLIGGIARAWGSFDVMTGNYGGHIEKALMERKYAFTPKEKNAAEKEAITQFAEYSDMFKLAMLGRVDEEGNIWDGKKIEGVLNQRFQEMFAMAPDLIAKRAQAQTDAEANKGGMVQVPGVAGTDYGVVASSLASVGGGGGIYASDAIDLASRTANATEQIAQTMEEWLAATYGGSPVSSE